MIRRLLREDGGFTLIEVLMASALFTIVLGASVTTFAQFEQTTQTNQTLNDSQDKARNVQDLLMRQLRNLASPTVEQPLSVERAAPFDLVFQTVDPVGPNAGVNTSNVRRVRYCLDDSNSNNELLRMQWQTWTSATVPALNSSTTCPAAWTAAGGGAVGGGVVADHITNKVGGITTRPVFNYNSASLTDVTQLQAKLFIDANSPTKNPAETRLTSGVFLRNQNKKPVAAFSLSLNGKTLTLNGSTSYDPEGDNLTYQWFDNGAATSIGSGIVFYYPASSGSHSITLKAFDAAGLEGDAPAQTVVVP